MSKYAVILAFLVPSACREQRASQPTLERPESRNAELDELRALAPPGTTESHQNMPVMLAPGKAVGTHFHKQWTLIYYIDAEDVPVIIDGIAIYPANNTAILLEPNTPHEVARNHTERPRLSLALRFADD